MTNLKTAIDQRQLVLHYQPQLDLQTGGTPAVEALVRWAHPTLGMLAPVRFLPLAEEAGLMPSLTAMVLDEALCQCAKWREVGIDLAVSVNISATNLLDDGLSRLVESLLDRHDLSPSSLILEITETTVIENFEAAELVIGPLADMGIGVSIDDFGAGFTALSYLSRLRATELKLDAKLVTTLAGDSLDRDRQLVRSTIALGHSLDLRVVAEGVEDQATLDVLRDLGCDLAQGYLIARPMSASSVASHVETQPPGRMAHLAVAMPGVLNLDGWLDGSDRRVSDR